ncbi:MAG: prefoldin subunit alpha [Nitrososphaerales archaeon]
MSEEEKIQALVSHMKMHESYLNDILAKENTIARLMDEGRLAIEAMKNISGQDPVEMLMPIGIGIYVEGSASPNSKLLINIGAGIAIEKSKDEAVSFVERRLKEIEVALRSMMSQKQEVAKRLEQIRAEVNVILQKAQKPS